MAVTKTQTVSHERQRTIPGDAPIDIREHLRQIVENIEKNWFDLSVELLVPYTEESYKTWGFETFKDYTEKELGLDYRIAMYRIQIGQSIQKFGITADQVSKIGGWTKFKEVCSAFTDDMTKKEIDILLSKAENMSFSQIKDFVSKQKIKRSGGVETKIVTMKFRFTDEQAGNIENALNEAKLLASTDNNNLAMEYICSEWLMNHNPEYAEKMQKKAEKLAQEEAEKPKAKQKTHANKGKRASKKAKKEETE